MVSIFYIYIATSEGIAGYQDGTSLIIERPPRASRIGNIHIFTFCPIYEIFMVIYFPGFLVWIFGLHDLI